MHILNSLIESHHTNGEANETDSSESDSDNDESLVQTSKGNEYSEIPAYMIGSESHGSFVTRDIPERFKEERDDRLMNSLIDNYAREVKIGEQKTGHMYCNHDDAQAVSREVIESHFKWDEKKTNEFLKQDDRFEDTWRHFDVNKDGLVEVERMPQFLRYVSGNALDIDL